MHGTQNHQNFDKIIYPQRKCVFKMESSAIDIDEGWTLGNDACKSLAKAKCNILENEFFN